MIVAGWLLGCAPGIPALPPPPAVRVEVGADAGAGAVVGIQPWLQAADYAWDDRLDVRVRGWLDEARDAGWLAPGTPVLLPAGIGAPLAVQGGGAAALRADTWEEALDRAGKPPRDLADRWGTLASAWAADYGVVLVAGTGPLGDGPDGALVLGPDGAALGSPATDEGTYATDLGDLVVAPDAAVPPEGDLVAVPYAADPPDLAGLPLAWAVSARGPRWDLPAGGAVAWSRGGVTGSGPDYDGPVLLRVFLTEPPPSPPSP